MEKILVLGSGGMAGHIITKYLMSIKKYKIYNTARKIGIFDDAYILDVCDVKSVRDTLFKIRPTIVINCIGILLKETEKNVENAILVNSYFPHILSRLGIEFNYKMIHISTDCVFSGKEGNYSENSFCDGDTLYSKTKALGEIINDKDLTIRTSIIGPELRSNGTGLFNWFMNQSGKINGYKNVFWSGVTTLELAKAIDAFISQKISGLYNLSPNTKISKFDLLNLIKEIWNKKEIAINCCFEYKSDKSLCSNRKDFNYIVKDYINMLKELYEWMDNDSIYDQYMKRKN